MQNNRIGMHMIHTWHDDALKVVANDRDQGRASGITSLLTYDGSGKAAGVKIYFNGEPQPTTPRPTQLTEHDPHRRPAARSASGSNGGSRLNGAATSRSADLRPGTGDAEMSHLAKATRIAYLAGQSRPTSGPTPKATSCSTGGSPALDQADAASCTAKLAALEQEEDDDQGPRHDRPRDAGADRAADGLHSVSRRIRQAPRPGDARHARVAAADAGRSAAATGWAWPSGCCGPNIR